MDEKPIHPGNDPADPSGYSPSVSAGSEPRIVSVKLKGVGGWLVFFIVGQLVLRPAQYFGTRASVVITPRIAARFPYNTRIIAVEQALQIGSMIAGILVGLALLKTGDKWPVLLAKAYLVATSLLVIVLAGLYFNTDLTEPWRTQLIVSGITSAVGTSAICLVWFLYFTKSKRVHATYLGKIS